MTAVAYGADDKVSKSGDTMTGPLNMGGNAVTDTPGITDWLNVVSQFGADPTGADDATTAILAAAAALPAAGGVLYFPAGTYLLNSEALTPAVNATTFQGAGPGATTLKIGSGFTGAAAIEIAGKSNCVVRDLLIIGVSDTYSDSPAADGVLVHDAGYPVIENVYTFALNGWAAQILSDATGTTWFPIVNNLQGSANKAGLRVAGSSTTALGGGAQVDNCVFQNIQVLDGLFFENAQDSLISNIQTWCADGGGASIHVKGLCTALYFNNIDTGALNGEGNATSQPTVLIEGEGGADPQWIVITNSVLQDGTPAVRMTAGHNIIIANCQIVRGGNYGIQSSDGSGSPQAIIANCVFIQSGYTPGAANYDINWGSTNGVLITGCQFTTPQGSGQGEVAAAINVGSQPLHANDNWFMGAPAFSATNPPSSARNNPGYNPVGYLPAQPPFPGDNGGWTNQFGIDCMVYITADTGTVKLFLNGQTVFTIPAGGVGSVRLGVGQNLTVQYTAGSPSWAWFGD